MGRRSTRLAERAFVAEGAKVVGEALAAGVELEALFVDPGALGADDVALAEEVLRRGGRVFELAPGVLERVAGTVTPQPLLGICPMADVPLDEAPLDGLVVVCADVRDPGNLGTVLRSAEASGARAVLCASGSVDPYNPKCVRASAGALFHVPLVVGGEAVQVLDVLASRGVRRLGTSAHEGAACWDTDLTGAVALVLGNEANGLPAEVEAHLDGHVRIPIAGRAESLNVGMAAAVLAFEAARQRADASTR